MLFQKRHPPVGSKPGTLEIPQDALPTKVRVYTYTQEELTVDEPSSAEEVSALLKRDGITWIDVQGFGTPSLLRSVAELVELHPLTLEDAVNVPQRAKTELFSDHQLIIVRVPVEDASGDLDFPQVALVLGDGWAITFQERYLGVFDPVRERMRDAQGRIRNRGVDYLAYALVDSVIDHYYPVAERIAAELDELEDEVIESPDPSTLARIHRARRKLTAIRRVGRPQRSAVNDLRQGSPFLSESVTAYLRDTHDHIAQIVEMVDATHDVSISLMEIYLSTIGQRTNEVMKVLTLMATIFIPLTFVAGIYGMNFEYMPELHMREGYPLVLAVMALLASGMLVYFWRRGWLGDDSSRRKRK